MSNFEDRPLHERVASIVLAGGQGTRLYPLTQHRCKPGVCFAGKYRLIDIPISNSLTSQIRRIFVISQYFASSLHQHISASFPHYGLQSHNLEMLCPEETPEGMNWFLGTADAVRKNMCHLKELPVDYFLILSGDQLYTIDLLKMVEFAREKKASLVIAAISVDEKNATRMGLLQTNEKFRIANFIEKPKDPDLLEKFCFDKKNKRYLGSMGIYVFAKQALIDILAEPGNDFGQDLIPLKIKKGNSFAFIYDGYWEDIGTISSYYLANLALTKQENCLNINDPSHPIYTASAHLPSPLIKNALITDSIISQGCIIEADEISNSVIGIRCHIHKGTVIRDSIVLGSHIEPHNNSSLSNIGKNCLIQKTIIDEQAEIGNRVVLTNAKNLSHYDGDGIFIRDGIIIVPTGTKVPDGYTL